MSSSDSVCVSPYWAGVDCEMEEGELEFDVKY